MFVYVRCNDKNKIWARKWRTEMNTHMKTLLNILIAITNVGSKHSNILTERDLDLKIKKLLVDIWIQIISCYLRLQGIYQYIIQHCNRGLSVPDTRSFRLFTWLFHISIIYSTTENNAFEQRKSLGMNGNLFHRRPQECWNVCQVNNEN